jgi:hypothetical protein
LYDGLRGFPGGSSLPRLLARHRGTRNPMGLRPLQVQQILAWADDHHRTTGRWPTRKAGPVAAAPGERWLTTDPALRAGGRGLRGGSSLARLLARHRGVRNRKAFSGGPLAGLQNALPAAREKVIRLYFARSSTPSGSRPGNGPSPRRMIATSSSCFFFARSCSTSTWNGEPLKKSSGSARTAGASP